MRVVYIKINVFIGRDKDPIASYFGGGIPKIDLIDKYIILPHNEKVLYRDCNFKIIVKKIYEEKIYEKFQDAASGENKYGTLIEDGGNTVIFSNKDGRSIWKGNVNDLANYIMNNCTEVEAYLREED